MNRFGHYAFEPVWRQKRKLHRSTIARSAQDWLFDPGSLTTRLVAHCHGRFHVDLVSQQWQRPMFNEAIRLGCRVDQMALVRQVYLYCDDTPLVFARTVIPHTSLQGPKRFLAFLDQRPLGSVLFADPGLRREEVEVARIEPRHRLFATATAAVSPVPAHIWGRRSVFYTGGKPLLVNEVFLPDLLTPPEADA